MRVIIVWSCIALRCFAVSPPEPDRAAGTNPTTNPPAEAKVAEYGPAFEQLVQLGVPDATGATYVKLTLHGDAGRSHGDMMYYSDYSGAAIPLKGNAWLLPGETDGASTLIQRGDRTIQVVKTAKRSGLMRALIGPAKSKSTTAGTPGDWTEVDVAKDATKILEAMEGQTGEDGMLSPDRWRYSTAGPAWCAKILLTACHMYRAGHHDEANRITSNLFRLAPQPILVVDQVVNDLASREYNGATETFLKSGDWRTYRDEIQKISDRFTRGWQIREGAGLLIARIDKQLQGANPSLTPLKGATLNPKAVEIVDAWLTKREKIVVNSTSCWLLGDGLRTALEQQGYSSRRSEDGGEPDPDRTSALCEMGMDGFIALTAAATDETLIAARMVEGSQDYYDDVFSGSYSGDLDPAEAQFAGMSRPCTRGEIARSILLQTLPDPEDDLSAASPAELQATAHQWWLEHRSDSRSQLARHFLEFGGRQQNRLAVMSLIYSDDDADAKLVEKHILEAEDLINMFGTVDMYLRAKRGKARPFFEAYSKALKEIVGDEEDDSYSNWQIREAGGIDKFLRKLSVYVDDISPEKIVEDMRKGALEYQEGFEMLRAAIDDQHIAQFLPALVSVARQQKTPSEQYATLGQVRRMIYHDQRNMDDEEELEGYQAGLQAHLAASKDDWAYFLEQEFLADESDQTDEFDNAPSLATGSAMMIEMIYFPQHTATLGQLGRIMSTDEFWDFLVKRSKQLVNGEKPPEFPTAEAVDEERRNAIRATLKPMTAEDILKHYEGLNLNEQLAWSEIISGYGEETPAGVIQLRKLIVKIHWPSAREGDDKWKKDLETLTDAKILDASVVEGVIKQMLDKAEHFQDLDIYLQTDRSGSPGITMSVVREGAAADWKDSILEPGYQSLRDGKAKKVAGIHTSDPGGDTMIGLRLEPTQKDVEAEHPMKDAIEQITKTVDEGNRFYAALAVETAENLKKREAEQENEPELDVLPSF